MIEDGDRAWNSLRTIEKYNTRSEIGADLKTEAGNTFELYLLYKGLLASEKALLH